VGLDAVRQYIALLWRRYQSLKCREDKSIVLDELCRNLQIHRKSAIRLMTAESVPTLRRSPAARRFVYSEWAKEHLRRLWRKMGYLGSVRLAAALPDWLPHYGECTVEIKGELLAMSARTIERILRDDKAALRRRMNTGTKRAKLLVTSVPLRDFDFTPGTPGHVEADTVCHCGESMSGAFARTVTVVDLACGWTECEAIETVSGAAVRSAFEQVEKRTPFAFLGLYTDNGGEFMNNDVLVHFAKKDGRELPVRRGRPYRKNDQARVEQKNFTHVRQAFGYDRITGRVAINMMNTIYRNEWRQLQNFFWPQTRVVEKKRIGSRIVRRLDAPKTPYQRLLDHPDVPAEVKSRLLAERERLNPFELRRSLAKKLNNFARYMKTQWLTPYRGKYHDTMSKEPTAR
jgi:hypothetical protein